MSLDFSFWNRVSDRQDKLHIFGVDNSSAFVFLFINSSFQDATNKPNLLLVPTEAVAEKVQHDLETLAPHLDVQRLFPLDVSPYSGLYPNKNRIAKNMGFYSHALKPLENDIFLTSSEALLLKAPPAQAISEASLTLKVGDEIPPDFFQQLANLRYQSVDLAEDLGHFVNKGGIIDVFSPYHKDPVRIELFGDQIESLRFFSADTQLSIEDTKSVTLIPCGPFLFDEDRLEGLVATLRAIGEQRKIDSETIKTFSSQFARLQYFHEIDFFLPLLHENLFSALDFFVRAPTLWWLNSIDSQQSLDQAFAAEKNEFNSSQQASLSPKPEDLFFSPDQILSRLPTEQITFDLVAIDNVGDQASSLRLRSLPLLSAKKTFEQSAGYKTQDFQNWLLAKRQDGIKVFFFINTDTKARRLKAIFVDSKLQFNEKTDAVSFVDAIEEQNDDESLVHIIKKDLSDSFYLEDEKIMFLNESFFFGKRSSAGKTSGSLRQRADQLHFSDLKPGDKVVHIAHGVGIFEGLKELSLGGAVTELLQLSYKDNDKLYVPIYRIHQIQKYSGGNFIDKLGSKTWEKNKIKVKNALRDVAADLLKIYAQRAQATKLPFSKPDQDFFRFEDSFPYDETEDQLSAIEAVVKDMTGDKPMDRLVCGDVGFGKTEVAIRAAFKAVEDGRQVALLVPTTILAFQHHDSFQKRFRGFNYNVKSLSRFTSTKEAREILADLKEGRVHILIGTHRLLSQDVVFKDLGLLIVDEEHRFGVIHKEKIRKLKTNIDTLAMSATPIPRTLNMSLVGIRDLSLITSPTEDRLPTRTFICKQNNETLRKALVSEVARGGQVYFVHNRVQSIYQREAELRDLVPDLRIRIGHGQMKEDELEEIMIAFFKHEFDVLLCTTIIESGIDNPKANTIIIDNAHQFGLSQLYQLRGRVGRGKERAYCYLVIPAHIPLDKIAQERLRVIQENTALGSGFKVASHDLELRGAGNILGDDQSGHVNTVGYDLYLELLEDALAEARGQKREEEVEPDINIAIPALIPDRYILDIRTRLAYYKAMSEAKSNDDMANIEEELKDQFGPLPEEVINLMGIMLIRNACKDLGVRDISSTKQSITLAFTQNTKVDVARMVGLAVSQATKYRLTPDNRLVIKIPSVEWSIILQELELLHRQVL